MKKLLLPIIVACFGTLSAGCGCTECGPVCPRPYPYPLPFNKDLTKDIPEVKLPIATPEDYGFNKHPEAAQYKNADWSNAVAIIHGITEQQALEYAKDKKEITYFFFTKGGQMVLETENNDVRIFCHGDAVFFSGKPWFGTAPGLADAYIRITTNN